MYMIGIDGKYWNNTNDNVKAVIEFEPLPVMCMSFNYHWLTIFAVERHLARFLFGTLTTHTFEMPDMSKYDFWHVIIGVCTGPVVGCDWGIRHSQCSFRLKTFTIVCKVWTKGIQHSYTKHNAQVCFLYIFQALKTKKMSSLLWDLDTKL